ncbi:MAG: hypothetical protein ABI665_28160 [Vicinamibacterales bacterium]
MPYQIKFAKAPAGYVLENAAAGAPVKIAVREFTSSEDGAVFVSRLEGFPLEILERIGIPDKVSPSTIDHMVAVIGADGQTQVYVNECPIFVRIRAARTLQAGQTVREDDIVDVAGLRFEGVDCPPTAGIVCVFSSGWRKGLFFDLTPIGPDRPKRAYDLESVLGSHFAYLMNQSIFQLSEEQWRLLFAQRWFPFVSLPKRLVRAMVTTVRGKHQVDQHLPEIGDVLNQMLPELRTRWAGVDLLAPHLSLLLHALDRYAERDYISATALLYPRIEGVLRSIHAAFDSAAKATVKRLSSAAVSAGEATHEYSWLLPAKFSQFLEEVYFANFQPGQTAPLSRHSLSHGVASAADFDLKSASIGVLIVDQLRFMMPAKPPNNALEPAARTDDD